ncbi:MAG: hypothetical protein HOQ24_10525, partial [Mycobacteriaceae bacterium]|nr:hypothetical protein [Mycobacteriaceae bacterium]
MDTNSRIRKIHRWISQIFTLTVIASFIVVVFAGDAAQWVLYTPRPPLFVLLFTGLD